MLGVFIGVAVALVVVAGFLAAADAAFGTLSRADLADLAERSRARRALLAIAADTGAHLNAVNFMRVVLETTAAVLVTLAFATLFAEWWWTLLVSALIMTAVSFVLVGSSPRSVGRAHAVGIARASALLVRGVRLSLGPVADLLVALGDRVTPGRPASVTFSSEQQLLSMVDEATEADVLEEEDRALIHSIFEWGDTVVREVMVPRTEMVTIEAEASLEEAMALFLRTGVSRVPVVGEDLDDVVGIVYLRDVARLEHERPLDAAAVVVGELARDAMLVPESKKADEALRQMQLESTHLAMVVDEYGGIAGLVTLEDLIEELVGEISDEYDRDTPDVSALGAGVYRVSARLPTDELGDLFGIELDDDEVDSVGGLLSKSLGRLPERGSSVVVSGLLLRAERVEGRRRLLRTVIVQRDPALAAVEDVEAAAAEGARRERAERGDAAERAR
ncbi:MAG: HlyC/CorC family transporter [Actinomycetales bacterium]|nr:HlyC/CorC family transporter [Actinomycetales bacterium]